MAYNYYEIGRQAANQGAAGLREARDDSIIDSILKQAMEANDPVMMQQSIGKILSSVSPERQPMAIKFLENRFEQISKQKKTEEDKRIAQEAGYTYGAPAAVQAAQVKEKGKQNYLQNIGYSQTQPQDNMNRIVGITSEDQLEQSLNAPQSQSGLDFLNLPRDKLVQLSGSPYKEISDPAKAALKSLDKKRSDDRADLQFETKQVSDSFN